MKPRIKLIHWHAAEAEALARRLRALGYAADTRLPPWPALSRELRRQPPAAIIISLDRLPSQGRDIALILLGSKATRDVPLVLAGGALGKVSAIRARLAGRVFTNWENIGPALAKALNRPHRIPPATPVGAMAGYSGTPLPRKLGIKHGMAVALLGAPKGFAETLGALPEGADLANRVTMHTGLALWFVHSRREFDRGLARAADLGARMPVWVISPKKSGALASDLSQTDIRAACLATGLVDYKVCAVDSAWSGLLFRRRRDPGAAKKRSAG